MSRKKGKYFDGPGLFWQTLEGELERRRGSYRGGNSARLEGEVMPANMLLYTVEGAPLACLFVSPRCLVALLVIVIIAYLSVFSVFFYAI